MLSPIDVINVALGFLGQPPIESLTGTSKVQLLVSQNYLPSLKEVLRAHPWNFAVTRVVLAPDPIAPAFGNVQRFLKPADWVRTLGADDLDLLNEGRYILANATSLNLSYIARIEDLSQWDDEAKNALARLLAHKFAYALTGSTSLADSQYALYAALLEQARNIDAQEEPAPQWSGRSSLLMVREG